LVAMLLPVQLDQGDHGRAEPLDSPLAGGSDRDRRH